MTETQLIQRSLRWTLPLTIGVAVLLAYSLIGDAQLEASQSSSTSLFSRNPSAGPSAQRLPAAAAPAAEIQLECNSGARSEWRNLAAQIRIRGVRCGQIKNDLAATVTVRNRSNGLEATVFSLPKAQFTTDYISLVPGENHLEITHTAGGGQATTQQVIAFR